MPWWLTLHRSGVPCGLPPCALCPSSATKGPHTHTAEAQARDLAFAPPAGKLDITPDDPRWIGAWWGGFLLCGALLFFSSLPMFGFPQSLPPRPERAGDSEQAMLPERDYERPKPSNGVLRHPLDGESSTTCFQQLRGETPGLSVSKHHRQVLCPRQKVTKK